LGAKGYSVQDKWGNTDLSCTWRFRSTFSSYLHYIDRSVNDV